ncbi:MAG: alpha/beta hydrolase [Aureispira sp.]|nr:alpha/beta hydrolase [Aureispira sp.]
MSEKKNISVPFAVKMLRGYFSTVGRISPSLAMPMLRKVLLTPKKRTIKPPHQELLKQATKSSFEVKDAFFKKKLTIRLYEWGSGEQTVVLAHGWDSFALDFYKLIPKLVDKGFRVVALDMPGHGQSSGNISSLPHFKLIMEQYLERYGAPYALIGHSLGGAASAFVLTDTQQQVSKLVMMANPIVAKHFFETAFDYLHVSAALRKSFYVWIYKQFGMTVESFNLNKLDKPIASDDIFVVYDKQDEVVQALDVEAFLEDHQDIQHFKLDGVGHSRIIKDEAILDRVVEFV